MLWAASLLAGACGDDGGGGAPARPPCDDLLDDYCAMPFPSTHFLEEDGSTATGYRMALPAEAMPRNGDGEPVDTDWYRRFDGFSPMTSLITFFPGEIDDGNLVGEDRIEASLEDGSPTILLDAETGERVAHFAELDKVDLPDFPEDPTRRSLYMRPAARLEEGKRYVAAIRGLRLVDGTELAPTAYFEALRDGGAGPGDRAFRRRQRRFEDEVFPVLTAAGVDRSELLVAWDFVTASGETIWGPMVDLRDRALAWLEDNGAQCTVTSVEESTPEDNENVWRRIEGTFRVPLYMTSAEPGAALARDEDGAIVQNGTAEAPFLVIVPHSVREGVAADGADGQARLLHYNHGQFGSRSEAGSSWQRSFAQRYGFVNLATDMWGMSSPDQGGTAVPALLDWGEAFRLGERLHQGVINNLLSVRSFRQVGGCQELAELMVDGTSVIGDEVYYLGISQGAIFGPTIAALSTEVERYVVNVGGISYPMLIRRSANFAALETLFAIGYEDKIDRDFLLVLAASMFDVAEGSTYAPHVIRDPLPGSMPKRMLSTVALDDPQVSNAISHVAARTTGLPLLVPSPFIPYGLSTTEGPADSAYQIWDLGAPPIPPGTVLPMAAPGRDQDPHEQHRRLTASERQWDAFYQPDGQAEHRCDGPCDPE